MSTDLDNANHRHQPGAARIAPQNGKKESGDLIMKLADLIQNKSRPQRQRVSNEHTPAEARVRDQKTESAVLGMTLHVPCYIAGRMTNGSRWKGKTKTVSLSIFGAHILLPEDVHLEGEISILFRIPPALEVLFSKDAFRVKAEIRPPDLDGHWPAPSGQKIVDVVFSHPLRFATWAA